MELYNLTKILKHNCPIYYKTIPQSGSREERKEKQRQDRRRPIYNLTNINFAPFTVNSYC